MGTTFPHTGPQSPEVLWCWIYSIGQSEERGKEKGAHYLVKVHHAWGQVRDLGEGLKSHQQTLSFETTESQELTQDSHILSTGKAEWGRAQAKSNKVPKDRRQAPASLGCYVLVPAFGTTEELSDEQKDHTCLLLSRSQCGVSMQMCSVLITLPAPNVSSLQLKKRS